MRAWQGQCFGKIVGPLCVQHEQFAVLKEVGANSESCPIRIRSLTRTLSGRGERMRADGPLQRLVGADHNHSRNTVKAMTTESPSVPTPTGDSMQSLCFQKRQTLG